MERFVDPYRSGKPIVINGRTVTSEDIGRVQINKTDRDSYDLNIFMQAQQEAQNSFMFVDHKGRLPADLLADNGEDVTGEFITGPSGRRWEKCLPLPQDNLTTHSRKSSLVQ